MAREWAKRTDIGLNHAPIGGGTQRGSEYSGRSAEPSGAGVFTSHPDGVEIW